MWASAPTKSPAAYASYARADRVIRPYNRLPTLHFVLDLSFRGREAPVGIRPLFISTAALAATYLCRSAAKARFDNRQPPKGVSKEGGPQPSLFGRSRMGDFQGGRKIETSFPLEWRSLDTFFRQGKKVTRRRHPAPGRGTPLPFGKESNPSETKKKEEALGRGRAPPLRSVYRQPVRIRYRADRVVLPYEITKPSVYTTYT